MPNLDAMLRYAMVSRAVAEPEKLEAPVFAPPAPPTGDLSQDDAEKLAIWHWTTDPSTPCKVSDITAIARGMGNARMGVLDALELESVTLTTLQGDVLELPLSEDFVVSRRHIWSGTIKEGQYDLFPLQYNLDQSLVYALAFAFPSGFSGSPRPCTRAELASDNFMPTPTLQDLSVFSGQRAVLTVGTPRVLVIWSVAFCKERANFEPGQILGAGRVFPHPMIMSNTPLREVAANVRFERPATLTCSGAHDHSKMALMNPEIEASLFADSNEGRNMLGLPSDLLNTYATSPFWQDLFDNYQVGVSAGTFRAVDPKEPGGVLKGVIQRLYRGPDLSQPVMPPGAPGLLPVYPQVTAYEDARLVRVPRQGSFDNMHVAPTMRSTVAPAGPPYGLERIYMAPFCEHDCFHLHWRWAVWNEKPFVFGFSKQPCADGTMLARPYAQPGAPMIPDNQQLQIELLGKSKWRYKARAVGLGADTPEQPIPAGTFSFFLHHGAAYALALVAPGMIAGLELGLAALAVTNLEPLALSGWTDDAMRYWRLRFGGLLSHDRPDDVMERLKIVDNARILARTP